VGEATTPPGASRHPPHKSGRDKNDELRSSRPHKAGRDDKERPSLPTFKIFVVVGPAFAGRTRRKRAGTTSSREETARMSHQSWEERYVGEKGPKRRFRGFSAPFPIVRKRFMVTGDFTQRELDHLEISKA